MTYAHSRRCARSVLAAALSAAAVASCGRDDETAVSYTAYNDTDRSIVSIIINGEGGVLTAGAHDGGGEACCVVIPSKWRPGLKVTIKWQEDGDWLLDENGREIIRNGKRVYVPRPYKQKIIEIPEYDPRLGRFNVHFLPNDEVTAVVHMYGPRHPEYPIRFPYKQQSQPRLEGSK